jgi:hypothetical protein
MSEGPRELAPVAHDRWVRASIPLERLTPLIHELTAWDLVYLSDGGEYKLREDVQRLLAERSLAVPTGPAKVFVGRTCQRCSRVTVTRLVEGSRICDACTHTGAATPAGRSDTGLIIEAKDRHHWLRRGHRPAS